MRRFGDNQGVLSLTEAPRVKKRSKHTSVRYHWIRERVRYGERELHYSPTSEQVADMISKALSLQEHSQFREQVLNWVVTAVMKVGMLSSVHRSPMTPTLSKRRE